MVELGFEPRHGETGMPIKRVRETRMQILEGPTQTGTQPGALRFAGLT